jgi:hypothetical protein
MSTWLPQSLFNATGIIAIDYYGINHSPQEVESDMRKMYTLRGKQIFLQEWGDYWNQNMSQQQRTDYLNQVYAVLQKLANEGILAGFNYWGGWDNNAEGILTKDASGFHLNYRGQVLANLYAANPSSGTVTPPPPTGGSTTPPPATVTCAAPATNAFSGCYFSDQNLGNPVLSRTDSTINFNWGSTSPDAKVPADRFSARWQGNFNFNAGDYTFTTAADDGVKVYIDGSPVIDKWLDQPATTYTATKTLSAGTHLVKVEYYDSTGDAVAKLSWNQVSTTPTTPPPATTNPPAAGSCPAPASGAFTGCYYSDQALSNLALSRTDSSINFTWNSGSPDAKVPQDHFSAKWEGSFNFSAGDYTFNMTSDDGSRLYIDGQPVINAWSDHAATAYTATKTLSAGTHTIKMEYYEAAGGAIAKLNWNQIDGSSSTTPTTPPASTSGFTANYYKGTNLSNLVLARTDSNINFTWNDGSSASVVPVDQFSARWTGDFNFTGGNHTFSMTSDDGSRLYIDGQLVINQWNDHGSTTYNVTKYLSPGIHTIKMEYYEAFGGAIAKLNWN